MLEIKNVTKAFAKKRALDGVSLTVTDGKIYGLLGPNGAGKTTLIRIINGITAPDSGQALLDNHRITLDDAIRIGYLPEERGLYKKMRVAEQVLYLAQLKGLTKQEALKEMNLWFNRFGIVSWQDKKIEELSKGMAQKVQFITTVIHRPKLLILDEPFSGFDPVNAEQIREQILRLNREGTTVILSTHNMESVEALCDEISLINQGRIVLQGSVADIKQQHKANLFRATYRLPDGTTRTEQIHKAPNETNNDLLQRLLAGNVGLSPVEYEENKGLSPESEGIGEIIAFEELLPTMNDIFLKVVKG